MAEAKKKPPGPKNEPSDKLTIKQKKLVKGIVAGKTQRQAAKEAGLNESYASNILKEPHIVLKIQDLMEGMGLSDAVLLIKHRELLNAQKQISGVKDADGGSVEFIEVPDYQTQIKALESAYKLKGAYVEKKEITGPGGTNLFTNIQINLVKP